MKKFRFSLESVLDYKQQALDSLKREHGAIVAQVKAQEDYLAGLESDYREMDAEFCQRKLEGIAILDAMRYEQYLRAMERQIQQAILRLEDLRRLEEAKRAEVVSAKQDTSAIEKLKDKKLDSYNKAVQKSEEAMIDEFVSTTRAMAALQTA
ncbi:MAG: flagellar export protein FliJ [Oscillospiraceae bacterium]|jgi:flagellar FliJ protein|nr:flagellar export protein FliJ [Oscillospiraceae bacterium]